MSPLLSMLLGVLRARSVVTWSHNDPSLYNLPAHANAVAAAAAIAARACSYVCSMCMCCRTLVLPIIQYHGTLLTICIPYLHICSLDYIQTRFYSFILFRIFCQLPIFSDHCSRRFADRGRHSTDNISVCSLLLVKLPDQKLVTFKTIASNCLQITKVQDSCVDQLLQFSDFKWF